MGSTHQKDACGSSPLARGLPLRPRRRHGPGGIIPARAGFTQHGSPCWTCPWDHPRSRGVYSKTHFKLPGGRGSSPLARGLLVAGAQILWAGRIIPARAGFTGGGLGFGGHRGDHPRSRGVYSQRRASRNPAVGSSPLARGLHERPGGGGGASGIIPARAGFTSAWPGLSGSPSDHPRSRGVYSRSPALSPTGSGSSPLARGLRLSSPTAPGTRWIIPARAGFTLPGHDGWTVCQDHPRSRGVYSPTAPPVISPRGSSPLARGLPACNLGLRAAGGIIPARAGFTLRRRRQAADLMDHPRSRGVYGRFSGSIVEISGSSPLARGLRRD